MPDGGFEVAAHARRNGRRARMLGPQPFGQSGQYFERTVGIPTDRGDRHHATQAQSVRRRDGLGHPPKIAFRVHDIR